MHTRPRNRARFPAGRASIQVKFALTFLSFVALIVGLGVLGLRQIESVGEATRMMRDVALPKVAAVGEMERSLSTHMLTAKRRFQTTDFREVARMSKVMRQAETDFLAQLQSFQQSFAVQSDEAALAALTADWRAYLATVADVNEMTEQGALRRAERAVRTDIEPRIEQLSATLRELASSTKHAAKIQSEQVEQEYLQARQLTITAITLSGVAAVVAIIWIARSVSGPLLKISAAMRLLTDGRDSTKIPDLSDRADEIGALSRAAIAFRDTMVETRLLAKEVGQQRERLEATVRNMPVGLCMFSQRGDVIVYNAAFTRLFGIAASDGSAELTEKSVVRSICDSLKSCGRGVFEDRLKDVIAAGFPETAIWHLKDDRAVSAIVQATPDGWMVITEDVTDRVAAEDRIRRLARNDSLTGLANRLSFGEALQETLSNATSDTPAAVMFIDLDRFKHINDTLGHPIGDRLLQQVSSRLQEQLSPDELVARLGGDEFAVIQPGRTQPDAALALGERIITQLSTPFLIEGHTVQIGGSVGIALAPRHGATTEDIQKHADLALYAVKEAGKGHCRVFDETLRQRQQALHDLEQALRHALSTEAFIGYYQPLIDIVSGEICGAECLARWQHPERGIVSPFEFIPLAEELGLIQPLGRSILRQAFSAATRWPEDLKVSVNLSPVQFHKHRVLNDVLDALAETGLDPHRVELEINEGVLLEHTDETLEILHALRSQGMSIALDDFGTGYSSLRYLRSFPFDRVKIDRAFVRNLPDDQGAGAIVTAISSLCATLGMDVTAEGIETLAQRDYVRAAGCSVGQGFLFAKPMPEEDFLDLVSGPSLLVGGV